MNPFRCSRLTSACVLSILLALPCSAVLAMAEDAKAVPLSQIWLNLEYATKEGYLMGVLDTMAHLPEDMDMKLSNCLSNPADIKYVLASMTEFYRDPRNRDVTFFRILCAACLRKAGADYENFLGNHRQDN